MAKTNSFFSMVAAQAKTGRDVVGTIAKIVPNNKKYEVSAYDAEAGMIRLREILEEGSEDIPDEVCVSEKNSAVAHYVCNPNPRPVPDATIVDENGKKSLVLNPDSKDCKKISAGSLKLDRVLGGTAGQLLITLETDKIMEPVELIGYDIQSDTFYDICDDAEKSSQLVTIDEQQHTYLFSNVYRAKAVLDKDGNEVLDAAGEPKKEAVFIGADLKRVVTYRDDKSMKAHLASEAYEEYYNDDENVSYSFSDPIISVRLVSQAGRSDIAVITKGVDDDFYKIRLFIDCNGSTGYEVASFDVKDKDAKVFLGGSNEKPPVITVKDVDTIYIKTGYGTVTVDDKDIVDALKDYNYFCGVSSEKNDEGIDVVTWIYANADLEVKTFQSAKTDRGVLFKLLAD